MGTVKAWTIPGRSGAMWTQTRAVAARTCLTLLPGFLANLGHMRLALPLHVAIMGETAMEVTTMEVTTMEDTTMEDPATVDTTMVATIMGGITMAHQVMVDITMGTTVVQIMDITADHHPAEEQSV